MNQNWHVAIYALIAHVSISFHVGLAAIWSICMKGLKSQTGHVCDHFFTSGVGVVWSCAYVCMRSELSSSTQLEFSSTVHLDGLKFWRYIFVWICSHIYIYIYICIPIPLGYEPPLDFSSRLQTTKDVCAKNTAYSTCLTQIRKRICTSFRLRCLPDAGLAPPGAMMHLEAGIVKMLGKQSLSLFKHSPITKLWLIVITESCHTLGPIFCVSSRVNTCTQGCKPTKWIPKNCQIFCV